MGVPAGDLRNRIGGAEPDSLQREVQTLSPFELLDLRLLALLSEGIHHFVVIASPSAWLALWACRGLIRESYTAVSLLESLGTHYGSYLRGSMGDFIDMAYTKFALSCADNQAVLGYIEVSNGGRSIELIEMGSSGVRVIRGIEDVILLGEPEPSLSVENKYMFPPTFDLSYGSDPPSPPFALSYQRDGAS